MTPRLLITLALIGFMILVCVLLALLRPAVQPFRSMIHADQMAHALAWDDLDADGQHDSGEPPLAGVCIALVDNPARLPAHCNADQPAAFTDNAGRWHSPGFVAGGDGLNAEDVQASIKAQCDGISISALPPQGYRATTPQTVHGCDVEFGFTVLGEGWSRLLTAAQFSP